MVFNVSKLVYNFSSKELSKINQKDLKETARFFLMMTVTGIAFTILGIACAPGGVSMLLLSGPLIYFGYNGQQVVDNYRRILNNPQTCKNFGGLASFDPKKIKEALRDKTICFDWAVEDLIEGVMQ